MATQEEIDRIKDSIIEELKAIPDKLPWYWSAVLGAAAIAGVILAISTCVAVGAACTGGTGGVAVGPCVWAVVKCILAALVAILALVKLALEGLGLSRELGQIEGKETALKAMKPASESE